MQFKTATLIFVITWCTFGRASGQAVRDAKFQLIAHRGGVVDSTAAENSLQALEKAVKQGYYMVETDLRLTKDSMLVTYHDANLKRTFGVDASVESSTWKELSMLENKKGYKMLAFEDVLRFCEGKLAVMIDTKIRGNDPVLFGKVIALLKQYNLYDSALMIGTDESTAFFTGKIKLSCTRKQLEENMQKPGYDPSHYYLFSNNISKEDFDWATAHNILVVGVINAWSFKSADPGKEAENQANALKAAGVTHFQIDSVFEKFFK